MTAIQTILEAIRDLLSKYNADFAADIVESIRAGFESIFGK